ncbi:MAG: RidA family protein [Pseudomonadota bacterium]
MTRKLISSGSPFEERVGYSRAVVQGDWCFIAGTTGYDYDRMEMPEDPAAQARNTLSTIAKWLAEAGFAMTDVVRVTYILTDRSDVEAVIPELHAAFGDIRPAATMLICELMTPEMKVEIQVDAFRGA